MRKIIALGGLVLALSPAYAQSTGKPAATPGSSVPTSVGAHVGGDGKTAEYDSDVTPHPTLCYVKVGGNVSPCPSATGGSLTTSSSSFVATAAGTGYAQGDQLDHIVITDPANGNTYKSDFWLDVTTHSVLSAAPAAGNITPYAATALQLPSTVGPKPSNQSLSTTPASDAPGSGANNPTYTAASVGGAAQATGAGASNINTPRVAISLDTVARAVSQFNYTANAAGTGYSQNDLLARVVTADPATGTIAGAFWINLTTGSVLASAPSAGSITPSQPTLANQTATQAVAGISSAKADGVQGVSGGVPVAVMTPTPSTDGSVQLALTANTRAQLATQIIASNGVVCKASPSNISDVLIGGSTVTTAEDGTGAGWPIAPGESWASAIASTAPLYFISPNNGVVFCHGN